MEIERIGNNKIRCALSEEEIQGMGFDIDEIIGNGETTQQFMRVVLGMVEEQEHISMENISPMVKAELLQDHSMAITFGGESELSFKNLVDTVSHIMSQMEPERLEELKQMSQMEPEQLEELKQMNQMEPEQLGEMSRAERPGGKKNTAGAAQQTAGRRRKPEPMICALRFSSLEHMQRMSRVCFPGRVPESSLYKLEEHYYLILDFTGFSKAEMRPFAFGTVEYDDGHYSDAAQIAHIREQGRCIMKREALEMLMQL